MVMNLVIQIERRKLVTIPTKSNKNMGADIKAIVEKVQAGDIQAYLLKRSMNMKL